jgi:cell division protein FtsI/penicillin-binding protein 2
LTDRQREGIVDRLWRRCPARPAAVALLVLGAMAGAYGFIRAEVRLPQALATVTAKLAPAAKVISKEEVRPLLDEKAFTNLTEKFIALPDEGHVLQVETTLDVDLQNYLLDKIDREHARYVGIVVMEAGTGRVLAMAGFDKTDPAGNPCLRSHFPAASIFKIVSAASAVDQYGLSADSPMHFNGSQHTLYKRQLTDVINRHTTTISFQDAFAKSINPVFGKLGGLQLKKPLLEKSAEAFGFNEPLEFELPVPPSRFRISDEPYNWAEVASGFNLDTTISPLHGAVMASAVVNAGRLVMPSIIDRIVDDQGQVLYRRQTAPATHQAMSPRAATALNQMMETTLISGTGRKAFRNIRKDKVLSRLAVGGKTGSIGSQSNDVHFDWFVGFARERQGQGQVVVAVMVAHEEYLGTRASDYARMAITRYFTHPTRPGSPSPGAASGPVTRRAVIPPARSS